MKPSLSVVLLLCSSAAATLLACEGVLDLGSGSGSSGAPGAPPDADAASVGRADGGGDTASPDGGGAASTCDVNAWAMVGQCYDRRARTPSAAPKRPTVKWTYTVPAGIGLDAVVDAKGRMLASGTSADGTGQLFRFSSAGGAPETLFTFGTKGIRPLALGPDGTLYTSDGADLIGLDVSGSPASLRWKITTPATGEFRSLVLV